MRSAFYVLRSTFFRTVAGLAFTVFFTCSFAGEARGEEGGEAVLEAATIEGAREAANAAREDAPLDAAAAYLAGVVDSLAGRPQKAFAAFGEAVRLAVASGKTRDALVAGLSLDELLGLVAYLPRDEIAALDVPDPPGNDPWWLWARLARVRLRLAVAAIVDDVAAVDEARDLLGCGPQGDKCSSSANRWAGSARPRRWRTLLYIWRPTSRLT
jgi:hypothetical protein